MVDEIKPDSPALRPRWPFTRRQVFAQIGVAIVILVSGMGIGTGGTILTLKDRIIWHPRRFTDRPRPPVGNIVKMWQTEYGLTDDQARQAEEAFSRSWASMRTIFDEVGQKQQAVHAKLAEDMKGILTPEQYQKWDQEFKERAEHFRGMRPGGRPGGPPGEHDGRRPDHGPSRGDRDFGPPPGSGPGGPEPTPGAGSFPPPPPQE
jgi:hypothetical protein